MHMHGGVAMTHVHGVAMTHMHGGVAMKHMHGVAMTHVHGGVAMKHMHGVAMRHMHGVAMTHVHGVADHADLSAGQTVLAHGASPTGDRKRFQAVVLGFCRDDPKIHVKFTATAEGNTLDLLLPQVSE